MKHKALVLAALAAALACSPVSAADLAHGESLQQENCRSCHDDDIYTRAERKIGSLAGLKKQVRRCELALGLQWFDEDIDAVTAYLNHAFYRFE